MKWVQHNMKREIGGRTIITATDIVDDKEMYRIKVVQDIMTSKIVSFSLYCLYGNKNLIGEYKTLGEAQVAAEKHLAARK